MTNDKVIEKKNSTPSSKNTTATAAHPNNPLLFVSSVSGCIYSICKMGVMNMTRLETPERRSKTKKLKS
jgi:hypothetical protein